jgi:hypothetical protein
MSGMKSSAPEHFNEPGADDQRGADPVGKPERFS